VLRLAGVDPAHDGAVAVGPHHPELRAVDLGQRPGLDEELVVLPGLDRAVRSGGGPVDLADGGGDLVAVVVERRGRRGLDGRRRDARPGAAPVVDASAQAGADPLVGMAFWLLRWLS